MGGEYESVPASKSTWFIEKTTRDGLNGFYMRIGLSEIGMEMNPLTLEIANEKAESAARFIGIAQEGLSSGITTSQMQDEWGGDLDKLYEAMNMRLIKLNDGMIIPDRDVASFLGSETLKRADEVPSYHSARHVHLTLKYLELLGVASFEDIGVPEPFSIASLGCSARVKTYWNRVTPATTLDMLQKIGNVVNTQLASPVPVKKTGPMYEAAHFFLVANVLAETLKLPSR